ncbi:MAG: hypothetical protein A3C84_00055 [Candidatus Ryanbacteria bacterium RIFCSPHIGHO2_02_FULL_48_12]|uniref:DUF4956 domain-containing protein n=1 Tax=Candidatus Ryanbacteria bacterium RIFCSPHIGHO2_01_FULL_48_27 TaxID=1802115 RepID=A0A1G2G5E4_9BACT|nr:MAG: hypothetical protein A2756_00395 [Candidatus Ryanbacteria bacterium RIFCSPHIGHO2_01_FULL_48_27]OGZ50497.1 MAG: hypothetical protein A3C84_00055 [Candidatus Ryanbacteria bacterium RIFCSPHIGHO2_02_FULL_48_12]
MENFLILAETEVNGATIVLNISLVIGLLLFVAWLYKRTHASLSYTQSSLFALILMGTVASIIMMITAQNVFGAFAFFIVFTLIRFRSVIKEMREAVFLLFAMIIGVAVGRGSYTIAILATTTISLIILGLQRWKLPGTHSDESILTVTAQTSCSLEHAPVFSDAPTRYHLQKVRDLPMNLKKYIFFTHLEGVPEEAAVLEQIKRIPGVEAVELISRRQNIQY